MTAALKTGTYFHNEHTQAAMIVKKPTLVSGESIVGDWRANFIITISDYKLSKFCADGLMWTVGMKGKEALGGWLFVTNYRIIFVTHPINRVIGEFSIPIEIVTGIRNKSFLIFKRVGVLCTLGQFEFVIWHIDRFTALVQKQRDELDVAGWHAVLQDQKKMLLSGNMRISSIIEAANKVFNAVGVVRKTVEAAINPLEFLRNALIEEALEKAVKNPINQYVGGR